MTRMPRHHEHVPVQLLSPFVDTLGFNRGPPVRMKSKFCPGLLLGPLNPQVAAVSETATSQPASLHSFGLTFDGRWVENTYGQKFGQALNRVLHRVTGR